MKIFFTVFFLVLQYLQVTKAEDRFTLVDQSLASAALSVAISSQTNVSIYGQSTGAVTLAGTGGIAPYLYSKDGINFQSSSTFSSLPAGNYTFTIKDASAATATVAAVISQRAALVLNLVSQSNVTLTGSNNGSVTLLAAGGTTPYQYSKDGIAYQASAVFGSLPAGNYTFIVKDASLSTATINVTITQSNTLSVGVSAQTNVAVIGQSTGSVTLSGAGGTTPYQYSKDGTVFQSSATFNGLAAGIYTFTIRDAALVTSTTTATITQPAPLALSVASKTNVAIFGKSTGSVTLLGSGGTTPYQFSKDGTTFQSAANFGALPAGNYTFTIKDATGATSTTTTSITQPSALIANLVSQSNVEIIGESTGTVVLSASGGTAPYQYSKDGTSFQSSDTFLALPAGSYTFTIKDAATATATLNVTITEPIFKIEDIKAMNNFTPNGDGVNDKWEIENVSILPDHQLSIFDRAGRIVLKVRDYQNDWDGTVNGAPLSEGTYYYAITFDSPDLGVKKGFITIVK
jgi:gliding motility-associated-like protein